VTLAPVTPLTVRAKSLTSTPLTGSVNVTLKSIRPASDTTDPTRVMFWTVGAVRSTACGGLLKALPLAAPVPPSGWAWVGTVRASRIESSSTRASTTVPSPATPPTVTVYVSPDPDTVIGPVVTDPVMTVWKSVASTPVTGSLNRTRYWRELVRGPGVPRSATLVAIGATESSVMSPAFVTGDRPVESAAATKNRLLVFCPRGTEAEKAVSVAGTGVVATRASTPALKTPLRLVSA
jgi:hypothetical protein